MYIDSAYAVNPASRSRFRLDATASPQLFRNEEILAALASSESNRYPDNEKLEGKIAELNEVSPKNVLLTAGADDGLERIIRLFSGKKAVLHTPTFEMIERYLSELKVEVRRVRWLRGGFPLSSFVGDRDFSLGIIVSPNNPTGLAVPVSNIETILQAVPQSIILLDLAYVEFAEFNPNELVRRYPNLLITRTFSKAWGLPGLRVGYVLGDAKLIEQLRAKGRPYAVSTLAQTIISNLFSSGLRRLPHLVEQIRAERLQTIKLFERVATEVFPSQANFILASFRNPPAVIRALSAQEIAVRQFPLVPEISNCLRINVPWTEEQKIALRLAVKELVNPRKQRGDS